MNIGTLDRIYFSIGLSIENERKESSLVIRDLFCGFSYLELLRSI